MYRNTTYLIMILMGMVELAHPSLTFLDGPLENITYVSVPTTMFLGPQSNVTVTGEFVYLPDTDSCNPGNVDVAGRLALIKSGACSYERQYDAFASRGVAGLLMLGWHNPGGVFRYMHDGHAVYDHIVFVQMFSDPDMIAALVKSEGLRLHATLSPDPNPWIDTFASWQFQVFMRYIPCICFAITSILSWIFLLQHTAVLRSKYGQFLTETSEGRSRYLRYLSESLSYHHYGLLLMSIVSPIISLGRGLGGNHSSALVPARIHLLMNQQLIGYTTLATVMASSVWNRIRIECSFASRKSVCLRCLSGKFRSFSIAMYILLFVNEITFSAIYATYANQSWVVTVDAFVIATLTLWIGVQFISSAVYVRTMALNSPYNPINVYIRRMSRLVLLIGVFMIIIVCSSVRIAFSPSFWSPNTMTLPFAIFYVSHSLECIILVLLFRPRHPTPSSEHRRIVIAVRGAGFLPA